MDQLTLTEKAALLSGKDTWQTRAIPRAGVRSLFMADGPHGIRKQVGPSDHLGINASQPATCFPTAATVANSWDPQLAELIGTALGKEAAHIGVDVLLGPGLNIKRSPLGGRNFEYFSEDPYLTGRLAAAYVRGIQSQGIAACPKHFAVNSQETRRMTSNSVVDEATLREIYLAGFEMVVREAAPLAIMSSYNRVNGTYAHENAHLLTRILRHQWGFTGAVVTDWGGGNDPVAAVEAGGTIEMPSPGFNSVIELIESHVDPDSLDARAAEAIALAHAVQPVAADAGVFDSHQRLAQQAAEQSIVLLKNQDGLLPLAAGTRVAVIGQLAQHARYQGAGSSLVNPTDLVQPTDALEASSLQIVGIATGYEHGNPITAELVADATKAASQADVVLLYLGLDEASESEGRDRTHLALPPAQVELLAAVRAVNPHVVVVLAAGSPIEMPWLDQAAAVVHGYLGGQAGAPAMVRVLTGEVNPSGHLAETYPLHLADTPTAGYFPCNDPDVLYREGPFVGYRYYTSAGQPVLFPFGFGLSYTTFALEDLAVEADGVSLTVRNTGERAGACVPQLYVSPPDDAWRVGPRPAIELKGFTKVALEAGESRRVVIPFDRYTFRQFDAAAGEWITVGGKYTVSVGQNAADLPLQVTVDVDGVDVSTRAECAASAVPHYRSAQVRDVTDAEFALLLGREVAAPVGPARRPLGVNSPLSDLQYAPGAVGRAVYRQYFQRALRKADRRGVPDLNLLFQYGMPFRAIAKMSGGLASPRLVDGVLALVNGHFFRGLGQVVVEFFRNRRLQRAMETRFQELAQGDVTASAHTETDKTR